MTDREKAIVMAYTGRCMLTGDKFQIYHKYVEDILGRPVWTHEIGSLADEIKEKSKADFIALCADEDDSEKPNIKALEQEPCNDVISRILKRMWNCRGKDTTSIDKVKMEQIIRDELSSISIRIDVLDKIRAEIEALPKTYPFVNHIDAYVKEEDVRRIINKYNNKEVNE